MTELPLLSSLIFMIILLGLSGFFSMSETSLFSLGRHQRDRLKKERPRSSKKIEALLKEPHKLITTILLADEVFNVAYTSMVALTVRKLLSHSSENFLTLLSLLIAAPTLLLLGEIGPKTIAVKFPRFISTAVAYPISYFHLSITPIRWVFTAVSVMIVRLLGVNMRREPSRGFSSEEVRALLGIGGEQGVMTNIERKLVEGLFKLEDVSAYKIMTPAIKCFMLPAELTLERSLGEVTGKGFSRIPVYKGERDNIVGILFAKDLLTADKQPDTSIEQICRPPYFIPTNKNGLELLTEFQQKRIHMAIPVDEYGRVEGVVTMEDILEELFGEFEDERRLAQEPLFTRDEESFIVPGSMRIDQFNGSLLFNVLRYGGIERLGTEIESSIIRNMEPETIGGFVFELFGRLPQSGEQVNFGSIQFTVTGISGKRISQLRVRRAEGEVANVA
ncbi:MAG: hemolysin family protein [Thermodesulfobacteriota bacterium]